MLASFSLPSPLGKDRQSYSSAAKQNAKAEAEKFLAKALRKEDTSAAYGEFLNLLVSVENPLAMSAGFHRITMWSWPGPGLMLGALNERFPFPFICPGRGMSAKGRTSMVSF